MGLVELPLCFAFTSPTRHSRQPDVFVRQKRYGLDVDYPVAIDILRLEPARGRLAEGQSETPASR